MTFQRIATAARAAQARVANRPFRYPQQDDWFALRPAAELHNRMVAYLHETTPGTLALVGPHGCGKTFQLLYLGHWWEAASEYNLAFYAPAPSALRIEAVKELWKHSGDRPCLWLLDDIHSDAEGRTQELVEEFEYLELRNHWLIAAGWSQQNLHRAELVRWGLTGATIRMALEALGYRDLASDAVVNGLAGGRVGLRQILWAARNRPDLLAVPESLEPQWADEMTRALTEPALAILRTLARLKFLGIPFLARDEEETRGLEEIRSRTAFADSDEPGRFVMPEDDIAQLILRQELSPLNDPPATARAFLQPLRSYLAYLLSAQLQALPARFMRALCWRTQQDIHQWLRDDRSGSGDHPGKPLIDDFLEADTLAHIRAELLRYGPLTDAVQLLSAIPGRDEWTRSTAVAMLGARNPVTGLETDLPTWRSFATLAHFAADPGALRQAANAAQSVGILTSLQAASGPDRGVLLDIAATVGEDAYAAFLSSLRETWLAELQATTPRGAWRRLTTIANREPAIAVQLLESLTTEATAHLILRAPKRVREFLALLPPRGERRVVMPLLKAALAYREVCQDDIDEWSGPWDLIHFMSIARSSPRAIDVEPIRSSATTLVGTTTNPAVLTDLTYGVAKFALGTKLQSDLATTIYLSLEAGRPPLVERLEALGRLRYPLALKYLARRPVFDWQALEWGKVFRLLWLAGALSGETRNIGEQLVRQVLDGWDSLVRHDHPLTTLGICGIGLYILEPGEEVEQLVGVVQRLNLDAPRSDATPPRVPQKTVCQAYGLARSTSLREDSGSASLAWLVGHLANPSVEYHAGWHRMVPSQRRYALAMLTSVVRRLASGDFAHLGAQLADGIAGDQQDAIWDDHLHYRLEATLIGGGTTRAAQLLDRRCEQWIRIIAYRILRSPNKGAIATVLRLLQLSVQVATVETHAKRAAFTLIDSAAAGPAGDQCKDELLALRNSLDVDGPA